MAAAIASGAGRAGWRTDRCPLGDGGEGTAAALGESLGGEERQARVTGPLGAATDASYVLLDGGERAALDAAAASGLSLVAGPERDAEAASSTGTGELIVAAIAAGAREVLVGVGGTAGTDGGAGAVAAIESAGGPGEARLVCLCDVRTLWEHAAETFGPQKGAGDAAVDRLRARLERLAGRLPHDPRGVPMTGAGGGLAGGLWASFGARLVAGASYACDAAGFDARLAAAAVAITGEGRLDRTTLEGKLVSEVAARSERAGVACHVLAGQVDESLDPAELGLASATEAATLEQLADGAYAILTAAR